MKKGKFVNSASAKRSGTKLVALVLALVLLVCGAIGGTLAWLTASTPAVNNTFTTSDINVELAETTKTYKMIPGCTIDKDPIVTVKGGSEDCWVFIEVEEKGGNVKIGNTKYSFKDFIEYKIEPNNWTLLETKDGKSVYYCYAKDITADRDIKVLAGGEYEYGNVTYTWGPNQVLTKPEVTKEMMNAIEHANKTQTSLNKDTAYSPALTFTAYAAQLMKNNTEEFTAAEAWAIAKPVTP